MKETFEQIAGEGKERLFPSVTNPSWLILRERRKLFQRWLLKLPARPLDVLDVGGRIQPYYPLLAGRLQRYIAVDIRPTLLVNVVARGEKLPFAEGQFDLVICTQVLEYVPEPQQAISEIYRVLRPGGVLLLSVPAVFPRDSDLDHWRFLPAGLKTLLGSFVELEILPEGSSLSGMFRSIAVCLMLFTRPTVFRRLFRVSLVPILNLTGAGLSRAFCSHNDQFSANFSAFARK